MNLWIAMVTGLTAGGVGCLTVQGGLLAGAFAPRIARDLRAEGSGAIDAAADVSSPPMLVARTILAFLMAKLVAHVVLGFVLGACGSVLQLSPGMRAGLMIVIGVFMIGNGLGLLRVHPAFQCFVIKPPSFIACWIGRASKKGALWFAPVLLGCLTVFLPCGVTQAMMAAAVATGRPVQAAALMGVFILGTMPVFFLVTYCAVKLGAAWESGFRRLIAVILVSMGTISCLFGFNLAGMPVALPQVVSRIFVVPENDPAAGGEPGTFRIRVSNDGYSPAVLHLPANQPVTLTWVTDGDVCCARSVVVPGLNYQILLPEAGQTPMVIPAQKTGAVLPFSCSTGRRVGKLVFE
jgi:sulfite exporter TauE/SafE